MARRRIPAATQALRKAAKEKAGTGNHGAWRHLHTWANWTKSFNKHKKRQKRREQWRARRLATMPDAEIDYSDIPSQAGKPFKRVNP